MAPMTEHIKFFQEQQHTMMPWPDLAAQGRVLEFPRGGSLFYYDSEAIIAGDGQPRAVSGKPAIVLIHGLGDEADSWRYLTGPLSAAGFRVIVPDLPGFGRSAAKGRISVEQYTGAVLSLMDALGAADRENPAVFAGSSMGALIAESAAFRRPDQARALILMDGCFPMPGGVNKHLLFLGLPFIGKKWYRAFREDHEKAWQSLAPYYHDLEALPEQDKQFLRDRVIARVESRTQDRAYFAFLLSFNVVNLFWKAGFSWCVKNFPGKILLLWGAEDQVVNPGAAAAIRSLRPDAAYAEIPGAGHLPHQEKPAETAAAICSFLMPPA
jgi:pimeloyl-ACP methyl ester carboxylesterase